MSKNGRATWLRSAARKLPLVAAIAGAAGASTSTFQLWVSETETSQVLEYLTVVTVLAIAAAAMIRVLLKQDATVAREIDAMLRNRARFLDAARRFERAARTGAECLETTPGTEATNGSTNVVQVESETRATWESGAAPPWVALDHSRALASAVTARLALEARVIAVASAINLTAGAVAAVLGAWVLVGAEPVKTIEQAYIDHMRRIPIALLMELVAFFFFRLYRDNLRERRYYQGEITRLESRHSAFQYALLAGGEHVAVAIRGLAELQAPFAEQPIVESDRQRLSGEVQADSRTRIRGSTGTS